MNKALLEQLELEKNKRELIKTANASRPISVEEVRSEKVTERKFAWEYELEQYRRNKLKDRFFMFGAVCGVLSLVITLYFHMSQLLALL